MDTEAIAQADELALIQDHHDNTFKIGTTNGVTWFATFDHDADGTRAIADELESLAAAIRDHADRVGLIEQVCDEYDLFYVGDYGAVTYFAPVETSTIGTGTTENGDVIIYSAEKLYRLDGGSRTGWTADRGLSSDGFEYGLHVDNPRILTAEQLLDEADDQ